MLGELNKGRDGKARRVKEGNGEGELRVHSRLC